MASPFLFTTPKPLHLSSKCKVMRFSLKNCPLSHSGPSLYSIIGTSPKFVESHWDLGVTIDRDLKFHCHVGSNVLGMGGLATNLLSYTLNGSSEFMVNVFVAHIRP